MTKSYITISRGIAGWFAVQMWWNTMDGDGFWEPWNTGFGRYATKEEAIEEGKEWAEAEELEFRENG